MIQDFVTRDGVRLKIGRIDRRVIDAFSASNPEPSPPTIEVEVEVFGEGTQRISKEDRRDPKYIKACELHYLNLFGKQLDIISDAVTVLDPPPPYEIEAIYRAGIVRGNLHADTLKHVVLADARDAIEVSRIVIYNSTVTDDGINEAKARFSVKLHGVSIDAHAAPMLPISYTTLYESIKAAHFSRMSWAAFCELTGPEQSELVAFMQTESKMKCLLDNEQAR